MKWNACDLFRKNEDSIFLIGYDIPSGLSWKWASTIMQRSPSPPFFAVVLVVGGMAAAAVAVFPFLQAYYKIQESTIVVVEA